MFVLQNGFLAGSLSWAKHVHIWLCVLVTHTFTQAKEHIPHLGFVGAARNMGLGMKARRHPKHVYKYRRA